MAILNIINDGKLIEQYRTETSSHTMIHSSEALSGIGTMSSIIIKGQIELDDAFEDYTQIVTSCSDRKYIKC